MTTDEYIGAEFLIALLQSGGNVNGISIDSKRASHFVANDPGLYGTGINANSRHRSKLSLESPLFHTQADRQRGTDCRPSMVILSNRQVKERHDSIADKIVHCSTVKADQASQFNEIFIELLEGGLGRE